MIKKMDSYQTLDVHIGKKMSPAGWQSVLDSALASGDYIVQRFVENDLKVKMPLCAADGKDTVRELRYMLSPFIMGKTMAGTFVRAWSSSDPDIPFDREIIGTTDDFICQDYNSV